MWQMNLHEIKKTLNNNAEIVFEKLGMKCEVFSDNIYSTCPIHDHSDNPRAFSFSTNKGIWKCWTRDCQHEFKNDIFGLITGVLSKQSDQKLEFKDALKWACRTFNINYSYNNKNTNVSAKSLEEDVDVFYNVLNILSKKNEQSSCNAISIDNYNINIPSEYFINRGFRKKTMQHFGVGDCHDKSIMKDRAIIPIHNDDGKELVGLIGRSTKEYKNPKFLLYPKGFDKRFYFYNYHRAIKKAEETSCLYISEGQGDVWRLYEAGVVNAVSIFGKNITDQQQEKLCKLPITHLIILTDNDQAGRESKVQIKRQLGRLYKLTFPQFSGKDVGDMSVKQVQDNILSQLKGTY